ncbi:MAG: hypothetical protein KC413_07700 [Anaerolineales bacterium]|nr:hypothetical protein [Anaerolineales bacterium]
MMTTAAEIDSLFRAGVAAVKTGNKEGARALLLQVVEADEQHELAWLWLSAVVDDDADRRVCLENVLTINPDNVAAQKGLEKLGSGEGETAVSPTLDSPEPAAADPADDEIVVRREYAPHSLASAVLYPEQQVKEWRYHDPTTVKQAPALPIAAKSEYDDIWTRGEEICAYCAQPVDETMETCPKCQRNLWTKTYRYAKPSVNLHIMWVLLTGIGQLFLIQGLFHLVVQRTLLDTVIAGILMLLFFGLAVGIYFRQAWAHFGAIAATGLLLLTVLIDALFPIDLSGLDAPLNNIDPAIAKFLGSMVNSIGDFIRTFQFVAVILALYYAIFRVAPDFQKMDVQETAELKKGLQFASDYHTAAKDFARKGMMATAVLHWQRAVGKEPYHATYLRALGVTYAQLGFFARSLDVLQSGLQFSTQPEKQADFAKLIAQIQRRQVVEGKQDE